MALDTYAHLQTAIATWLIRNDQTANAADFITLAEGVFNNVLRAPEMVASAPFAVAFTALLDRKALPADFLEAVDVVDAANTARPLQLESVDSLNQKKGCRLSAPGIPVIYAIAGLKMLVAPVPLAATTYNLTYYQRIPALTNSNTTNWLLTTNPDLYLNMALYFAYDLLKDEDRATLRQSAAMQSAMALVKRTQTANAGTIPDAPKQPYKTYAEAKA